MSPNFYAIDLPAYIHVQYRRFDSNGKALFLIVRTVQIDSSYSIGIRAIQIDQMGTIFFHSTHARQMVKWYHAVYYTVCRNQMDSIFSHLKHACQMVKRYHAVYNAVYLGQLNGSNGLHFLPFEAHISKDQMVSCCAST